MALFLLSWLLPFSLSPEFYLDAFVGVQIWRQEWRNIKNKEQGGRGNQGVWVVENKAQNTEYTMIKQEKMGTI